ncbi:MAG: hypothetical protein B7Z75_09355 [Acidocella sp. 20-57-95]|nr:MAG: hypothetical protein B7Z75_09355 [Acidocella sp. 20-57-95]HQT65123.1 DUF5906 domain-containing protein [Acidocella sp.]
MTATCSTQEFLETIVPPGSSVVIGVYDPVEQRLKHKFHPTAKQAAAQAAYLLKLNATIYFGCAGFGPRQGGRKGENVTAVGALWCDLDVGESKPYKTKRQAAEALVSFYKGVGLPQPMIVDSGYGIHAYWLLAEPVSAAEWKPVARALKAAMVAWGLQADPKRTADVASVLRPVGTMNFKDPGNPKPVKLVLASAERWPLTEYARLLGADEPDDLGTVLPAGQARVDNSDLTGGVEPPPPADPEAVMAQCAQLRALRDTQGNIGYPEWYACLGVLAYCEGGDDLAHELSSGHPKYSAAQTQRFLDDWRRMTGAATCQHFKDVNPATCAGCTHAGKCPVTGTRLTQINSARTTSLAAPLQSPDIIPLSQAKSIMSESDALVFMNARYGWCNQWGNGNGTYIEAGTNRLPCPVEGRTMLEAVKHLRVLTIDKSGTEKPVPIGPWWQNHIDRRIFDRAIYDPEQKHTRNNEVTLPLWTGFAVTERPGTWSKMRRHLRDVWCNGDKELFRYVVQWMAYAIQHPGTNPGTVLVVKSAREGSGKTMGANWLAKIFGSHAYGANTAEQVTGRFNDHLERVSLLVVNEPPFAGSKEVQNKLKSLITESSISIERKFGGSYMADNNLHIIMTTNEEWAVNAGSEARRYVILEVNDKRVGDTAYFNSLAAEADSGGIEAMFWFLKHLSLRKFNPRTIPINQGLRKQQMQSLSVLHKWGFALCDDPALAHLPYFQFGQWASSADLFKAMQDFASAGRHRPADQHSFVEFLALIGATNQRKNVGRGWVLPDENTVRAAVTKLAGIR